MTTSLYDLSVGSYLQVLSGMKRVLDKGAEYAQENDIDPDSFVSMRLHDDMLPFLFQVNCIREHSIETLDAIKAGLFTPPSDTERLNYAGLQAKIENTRTELEALTEEHVNELSGKTVIFKFKDYELPFTAENFVMSFSLPNLYFHATTAYDILRQKGVPLGKADYLGKMRIGV